MTTPTATQVREDYAHLRYHFADGWSIGEERVQFDNWLAAEIAAAEQRGAARAFNEAANEVRREMRWQYEQNISRNGDTGDSIDRLLELEKVFKYHADQIGG